MTAGICALFALFGGICGVYVSVVGFAVTAAAIVLLLGSINSLIHGPFHLPVLLLAFVVLQVGYFASAVGGQLILNGLRGRTRAAKGTEPELRVKRD